VTCEDPASIPKITLRFTTICLSRWYRGAFVPGKTFRQGIAPNREKDFYVWMRRELGPCDGSHFYIAAINAKKASKLRRKLGCDLRVSVSRGNNMKSGFPCARFCIAVVFGTVVFVGTALGQTYGINGQAGPPGGQKPKASVSNGSQDGPDLGWGSSIDVAREARAAQDALKRNDCSAAVPFAERAAKSASQNPELWFLLGYAARLCDRYQASIDAYNRGLRLQGNSIRGLGGLAQTYAKMGRDAEAVQLLQRVIDASPRDPNNLQLAGELLLNSDPKRSLDLLRRANDIRPSAHTDLLMAHAYDRLGQPDESARSLTRARTRAPKDPEVLRALAAEYRNQGQYDLAISTLQAVPSKASDVQAELAYTYQLASKPQEAADLYSRVAKSDPGNIGLNLSAAQALVNLGQADKARPFLDDARKIDGNNYRLHAILGAIAETEERAADAGAEYALALANVPKRVPEGHLYGIELRLHLFQLAVKRDDQAAGKQQLEAALADINQVVVPESSRSEKLRLRAAIEAELGNLDAADKDLKEALALAPANVNSLTSYGNLQWKLGQKDAARDTFSKVLEIDKDNRTALLFLGHSARDKGEAKLAETYFTRAVSGRAKDYAPYLALGDLYTAEGNFHSAEANYEEAFRRMPGNPLIVAGGANAALEARELDLAKRWLDRATGNMNDSPQLKRERERYLTFKGDYAESARLGYEVLEKLPNDREAVIYLAYDLYYLGRHADAMGLVIKYDPLFANDKDLALIAGYIHARDGQFREALSDFTRALERDPKMATGYVNRGFVLTDLREGAKATKDFQTALQLRPDYGEAYLGLAFADLQLHRPKPALTHLDAAQRLLGESHSWHLARAEAFRQLQDFVHAEPEYRAALEETPNDLVTRLAYAYTLYHMRRYQQSITEIGLAQKLAPADSAVYALRAQVHAKEGAREETLHDIQLADQYDHGQIEILMATGDALLTLGDRDAAMQRFSRALDAPKGNRVGVRLALAQVFWRKGRFDDARQQIALAFTDARVGDAAVTAEDLVEAANIFLAVRDFDLAGTYFDKASLAGANPRPVAIGLTNTYLAQGETRKAETALASLGPPVDFRDDYDYMMASANLYRQRHDTVHALSDFAQASAIAGQEDKGVARTAELELAGVEGRQINEKVSFFPSGAFSPQLEDINVYALDAKILHVTDPSALPLPRHSFQSLAALNYRVHLGEMPVVSGFVGQSMTTGRLSFPSADVIQDRHTYDTILNGGITPVLHLGSNSVAFNGGLQFTIRRDTISPVYMSQNLFRQFLYVSTSSFFNWIAVNASAVREAGPFTDQNLRSRDASASLQFTVGRPWGRTSLLVGYTARDLLFQPRVEEYFSTSSYIGLQHKFGSRLTAALLGEYVRSWRVHTTEYAIAQALLPGARFEFRASPRWNVQGSFLLSRGEGYHFYDNARSEFLVSYERPVRRKLKDGGSEVSVAYPVRLSFGLQQQTFYNFAGSSKTTLLPVVHLTLF
jgi:tetratricopeptide (TPR) repeat protein